MGVRDPRIDSYISSAAPFAQPILAHLRDVVHDACPDVEETLKWSMPHFLHEGILCSMAAFKQHCVFGFHKGALIVRDDGKSLEAMGQFGRITTISDLPPRRTLTRYVREAVRLNEEGVKVPGRRSSDSKPEPAVPEDLAAALEKSGAALATFEGFSPSHRREYIEWVTEAKREDTRKRRIATAIEWLSEGKPRNWKYVRETRPRGE